MEFKGTKGKWRIDVHESSTKVQTMTVVSISDGKGIANMLRFNPYEIPKEVSDANAKLIAAAPELLEALKAITDNIENWLDTGIAADKKQSETLYNNAISAINKALI